MSQHVKAAPPAANPPVLHSGGPIVAVIGNPNVGKTTLFNALTGLNQHVGNYPGVTVERKAGFFKLENGAQVELLDLPGTYSLAARSPDEMIAVDVLLGQQEGTRGVDAVLAIADASNPERNFYLISQLCELGLPVVIALNMMDVAENKGIRIDLLKLSANIGAPVVGICANKGKGLPELRAALQQAVAQKKPPSGVMPVFPDSMNAEVDALLADLRPEAKKLKRNINRLEAFRILVDKGGHAETRLAATLGGDFKEKLSERRQRASKHPLPAEEVRARYTWARKIFEGALTRPAQPKATRSDAIDKVVTHWFSGTLIFALMMLVVFQSIFKWATPLMDWIKDLFKVLGSQVEMRMPEGALRSLISSGIIDGVGAVLVFLPQICLLFLFIAIMEDCGYMARAAFLMDRLLSRVGLSGKSFIPMLSSFACAVPGIMATRTIENRRDRLTTILVSPLMSCSARLPVYTMLIWTFIPERTVAGFISLRGLTLFSMYCVGIFVAVPVAWVLKKTLLKGETPPFLIELPSFKVPDWRTVLLRVYDRGKAFAVRAGTIILAVNIVVWALAYFPHSADTAKKYETQRQELVDESRAKIGDAVKNQNVTVDSLEHPRSSTLARLLAQSMVYDQQKAYALQKSNAEEGSEEYKKIEAQEQAKFNELVKYARQNTPVQWKAVERIRDIRAAHKDRMKEMFNEESGEFLRESYFGRMGHAVEPLFKPLGWDWRISMAALASFPAREVIVATMGTIFNLGTGTEASSPDLSNALRGATWDNSPRKLFNIPVALSIMVFFALCSQCAATLATIKRETNSWGWPIFSFTYMTALAWLGGAGIYWAASALGW